MTRTRVAVLRGGPSTEYDISMKTGSGVLGALATLDKYFVKDIVVARNGEWLHNGFVRSPEKALADIDVVFIALHGAYGEDGTLQRTLDRIGVPYTGSGAYPSSIAMSKALTKNTLKKIGIRTPNYIRLTRDGVSDPERSAQSISSLFGPQYFIKPEKGGSSIHTYVVSNPLDLAAFITKALQDTEEILVEERVVGKEATVGILEKYRDTSLYQLPPIEIVPPSTKEFFDLETKYDGTTEEICPGRFSKAEKQELLETALAVHKALDLRHYSRSDFIVADSGIYFLEVNTLPGLTTESLFPKAMQSVGASYEELVDHLISLAIHP